MAKTTTDLPISPDLVRKYGKLAFIRASEIEYDTSKFVSISPAMDVLTGGIPSGGCTVILSGDQKCGKALRNSSLVHTPNGPVPIEQIRVGDTVCAEDGTTTVVCGVFPQGLRDIYRVTFADGDFVDCDREHLWTVKAQQRQHEETVPLHRFMKDLWENYGGGKRGAKWSVQLPQPCVYEEIHPLKLDPYLMGLLLGDGSITQGSPGFSTLDTEILNDLPALLPPAHVVTGTYKYYYLTSKPGQPNYITDSLRHYNLWGCNSHSKFIPSDYRFASIENRWSLLQGLMDTGGTISKRGHCSFTTTSSRLALDIKHIVTSLGGICTVRSRITTCQKKIFKSFRCHIRITDESKLFRLTRKKERVRQRIKPPIRRRIVGVEYIGLEQATCIKVESNTGLFLTDNHVVTHNTVTALQIAANAQKMGRQIYYFSIEARLKPRDSEGIEGLDREAMVVIRSYKDDETGETKIFTAEEYLKIAEDIMHTQPGAVLIFDSISMLATEKELESDLEDAHRAPGPVLIAKFLKRMKDVIAVNDIITISILHLIANTSGYGKAKNRSGGRKILYAADIDLECKSFKFIQGPEGRPIGQEVEWMTHATPTVGPGHKMTSIIRYGVGIDKIEEVITLAGTYDGIKRNSAWYQLNFLQPYVDDWGEGKEAGHKYRFQGKEKVRQYFEEHPDHFDIIHQQVVEMFAP